MDTTTEDTGSAESGFICDDDEDRMDDVSSRAVQFSTADPTRSRLSSLSSPHQLGSTHDPFSQFPVRWEEAFGPLVQFCKSSSCTRIVEVHVIHRSLVLPLYE